MDEPQVHEQSKFWADWVARSKAWEDNPDNVRRAALVLAEVAAYPGPRLKILDVGCGTGWLALELARYGEVTAIDLAWPWIEHMKREHPHVHWIGGDFLTVALLENSFDVVTSLETIAHVYDQRAFATRIARLTKPGGTLVVTTQNKYIWERTSWLAPPQKGQIRNWPPRERLMELFSPGFMIRRLVTCAPGGDRGLPGMVNSRLVSGVAARLLGRQRWTRMRERWGLGRSLVLAATRRNE